MDGSRRRSGIAIFRRAALLSSVVLTLVAAAASPASAGIKTIATKVDDGVILMWSAYDTSFVNGNRELISRKWRYYQSNPDVKKAADALCVGLALGALKVPVLAKPAEVGCVSAAGLALSDGSGGGPNDESVKQYNFVRDLFRNASYKKRGCAIFKVVKRSTNITAPKIGSYVVQSRRAVRVQEFHPPLAQPRDVEYIPRNQTMDIVTGSDSNGNPTTSSFRCRVG